jgi:flagellar protein FliS
MNRSGIAERYRWAGAHTAGTVGRIVAIYDAIVESLRRAAEAARSGQVETRAQQTGRALDLIAVLDAGLDHDRGGEVARRLHAFYAIARARILQASLEGSAEGFERQMRLFASMREAWHEVEQRLGGAEPDPSAPEAGTTTDGGEPISQAGWSA